MVSFAQFVVPQWARMLPHGFHRGSTVTIPPNRVSSSENVCLIEIQEFGLRSPSVRRRYFLRETKRYAHKVLRNAVLCRELFKKCLRRSIIFEVAIQEVQSIESNPGVTRVGVLPSVIGYLIFRKTLRRSPCVETRN
jgi:hypothetical protein